MGAGSGLSSAVKGHPKWENCVDAFGLRFERVRIEGAGVVDDVQIMNPVKISEHVTRAKSDGIPVAQVMIDPLCLESKTFLGREKATIVIKVMYSNLEAADH